MTEQPEALRLAQILTGPDGLASWHREDAAAELRRLHMENEDLKNACKIYKDALKEEKALNAQLLEALEFIPASGSMLGAQAEAKRIAAIAAAKGEA
jgi:hypothetical protein